MSWASDPLKAALVVVAVATPGLASAQWFTKEFLDKIKLSGYRNIGYHSHSVTGDRQSFNIGNYGGLGNRRFTDFGFMRVEGSKVGGLVDFELNLQDSRFQDPQAQQYTIGIDEGPWDIDYGDIRVALNTNNRYVRLNKYMRGAAVGYESGPLSVKAVRSEAKGQARTVTLQGTNSPGPYYLQSSQILRGSEQITLDGILQIFGEDYTIDYDLGAITFINRQTLVAKVIPPTSTIVATYESFGFNGSAGNVDGLGVQYSMGKAGRLGVTMLRQTSGGDGRLSTRLEKFQGYGPPSTPYFLQFEPLSPAAVTIRVDGILQVLDVDYVFDVANPAIFYFTRFMPPTSEIDVLYTPKPTADVVGDRENIGFDYTVPLNDRGNLSLTHSLGKLSATANPTSGTASSADFRYTTGKWTTTAGLRSVSDGFVSLETTSFSRNEQANDIGVEYRMDDRNVVNYDHLNTSLAARGLSGNATEIQRVRFTRDSLTYRLGGTDAATDWPVYLSHTRSTTKTPVSDLTSDKTSLATSRRLGNFNARLSVDNESISGTTRADVLATGLEATYAAGAVWNFSAGASLSQIRSEGETGTGREVSLAATYRPSENFFSRLVLSDNDAGNLSRLPGFQSGYGVGYGGNGFTGGPLSNPIIGATNGRRISLVNNWEVDDRLSLYALASLNRTTGNISSNTETQSASIGIDYDVGNGHRLTANIDRSDTRFIESTLKSDATSLNLFFSGTPSGSPWRYDLGLTTFLSGGSNFAQNVLAYDARLAYRINDRQGVSLNANYGRITGYLPQDDLDLQFVYSYRIWEFVTLNLTYRFRDVANLDPNVSSGAYRSSGFDIVFSFNFLR